MVFICRDVICRDENFSSVEMKTTDKKHSKINNLQHAKYIFKNIYNSLSNTCMDRDNIYRETSKNKKERDFVKDNFQLRERLLEDYKKWGVPVEEVPVEEVPVEVTKSSSTGNKIVPLQEPKTAKKQNKINNLQHAKYIFKNIYNNLSNIYIQGYIYRDF